MQDRRLPIGLSARMQQQERKWRNTRMKMEEQTERIDACLQERCDGGERRRLPETAKLYYSATT
jgi:hypothetical protein